MFILKVIKLFGPSSAKSLATILQNYPQLGDLERSDINSILYRELHGSVRKDEDQLWHLVATTAEKTSENLAHPPLLPSPAIDVRQPQTEIVVTAKPEMEVENSLVDLPRPKLLRATRGLRAGLPPTDCLELLTVGAESALDTTDRILSATDRRWAQVVGAYGEGKSHHLALMGERARKLGFATCHISCDGHGVALNHPQRYIPMLLASLEMPGDRGIGYEHLLRSLVMEPETSGRVQDVIKERLMGGRLMVKCAHQMIDGIVSYLGDPEALQTVRGCADLLGRTLSGEMIRSRQGTPDVRFSAYDLLMVAGNIVRLAGANGIVLLVDEVESVFTKLYNGRSREGAYRVLSGLCSNEGLKDWRVVLGVTPDASKQLESELLGRSWGWNSHRHEPLEGWVEELRDGSNWTVRCQSLDTKQRAELLKRVRMVYGATYQGEPNIETGEWTRLMKAAEYPDLSLRLLVREAVDILDRGRFAARRGTRCPE